MLKPPPLTEASSPLARFSPPPLTEAAFPLAVLSRPPLTEAEYSLAVLRFPPLTEANGPLIPFNKPTTNPPKLEKFSYLPTTTLCEPVRLSMQSGARSVGVHMDCSCRDSL